MRRYLLLTALMLALAGCALDSQPTPTPTRTPRPAATPLRSPAAGLEVAGWRGTVHSAVDDPDCDDYFVREAGGLTYGIHGASRGLERQLADLTDTDVPIIITGTLFSGVADMRGLCIEVRALRRADVTVVAPQPSATPLPPSATPEPTATWTPEPTPTPSPSSMPTPTSLPQPIATPTSIPSATPTPTPSATPTPSPTPTRLPVPPVSYLWTGEYFANTALSGAPALVRRESNLNLNWHWGSGAPSGGLPADYFSARWRGTFFFQPVRYRFLAAADDGVRVYLDGQPVIDEWHQWQDRVYVASVPVRVGGSHEVVVDYQELEGSAWVWARWEPIDYFSDWMGDYFASRTPGEQWVMTRNDREISFDWGYGSPHPSMGADAFSVRWTRGLHMEAGAYRFSVRANDGVRLRLDGRLVFENWFEGVRQFSTVVEGISPEFHTLELEYFEGTDLAFVQFSWEYLGTRPGEPLP